MGINDIEFPNLGIYLTDLPNAIYPFGFKIAFYGIIIAVGLYIGTVVAAHLAKKTSLGEDMIWSFILYAAVISIICARLYYVAFEWDMYKDNLKNILNLREGGLAIYGGVIGAFITIFCFSKAKKINPLVLGDCGVAGLILGQAIGRWGNFFNREVFGGYTDNLVAMRLPLAAVRSLDVTPELAEAMGEGVNYIQVHPTFLYESLWNIMVFVLIMVFWKRKKFDGEVILWYLGGYGLGRAWIEYIRTDQLYIPGTHVPVSMVVAIVLVVFSIVMEVVTRMRIKSGKKKDTVDLLILQPVKADTDSKKDMEKETPSEK